MPEMTTLCQDGTGTPPTVFGSRAQQAAPQESSQNFYSQPAGNSNNGYSQPHTLPPHPSLQSHYSNSDGYGSFQPGQSGPQHQMDFHHHHIQQYQQQQHQHHPQQQHQHHQQFPPSHLQPQHHWGYGMNGTDIRGGSGEDHWGHGYYFHQTNGYHAQNPYGYQYRTPQHPGMEYGSPLHMTNEADRHNGGEEGESPSPHSDEDGEGGGDAPGCGPNNQGAKSLRPPYEWMKPSPSLPQPGHVSVFPGKTRTKDKYRVVYSDHQRLELEKEFHFSKYITIRRKSEIAGQLGLSERQVKIWFQNRRAKERKQNKKREDQAVTSQTGQSPGINGDGNCKPDIIGSSSFLGDGSLSHDMNSHHLEQHHHLHQHMALSSAQEEESHSHSFIPKLEVKEEDIAVKQEHQHQHQHRQQQQPQPMANHNGTPLLHGPYLQTTLSPQTTPNAMTNHASLRTPPTMSTPTNPHANYHSLGMQLGRNLQHGRVMPTMDRYNSPNGNFGVSTSTPTPQGPEEMAYRLPVASAADSSGNSMNLSGSSDSGIMS